MLGYLTNLKRLIFRIADICTKYNIVYTAGVTSLLRSITSFVCRHNFVLCPLKRNDVDRKRSNVVLASARNNVVSLRTQTQKSTHSFECVLCQSRIVYMTLILNEASPAAIWCIYFANMMLFISFAMMRCLPHIISEATSSGEAVIIGEANIICRRQTSLKKAEQYRCR